MKEYIDREEMLSAVCRGCNEEFSDAPCEPSACAMLRELKKIPTADVVEVVRCRDCKHATFYSCKNDACYRGIICEYRIGTDDENFFCGYGERKEQKDG